MIRRFGLEGIQKKAGGLRPREARVDERPVPLGAAGGRAARTRSAGSSSSMGVRVGDRPLEPLIDAVKARSRTVPQLAEQVGVRLDAAKVTRDAKAEALAQKLGAAYEANLALAARALGALAAAEWNADQLVAALKATAESTGIKLGRPDAADPGRADRGDGVGAGQRTAGGRGAG